MLFNVTRKMDYLAWKFMKYFTFLRNYERRTSTVKRFLVKIWQKKCFCKLLWTRKTHLFVHFRSCKIVFSGELRRFSKTHTEIRIKKKRKKQKIVKKGPYPAKVPLRGGVFFEMSICSTFSWHEIKKKQLKIRKKQLKIRKNSYK